MSGHEEFKRQLYYAAQRILSRHRGTEARIQLREIGITGDRYYRTYIVNLAVKALAELFPPNPNGGWVFRGIHAETMGKSGRKRRVYFVFERKVSGE